jgi:hypothetical protein
LFAGQSLPAPPTASQPHFSEQELQDKAARDQAWKIPSTAQYPRKVKSPPRPTPSADILSSSDDDDYVSAFRKKPSMKTPTKQTNGGKTGPTPDSNASVHPHKANSKLKGPIEFIAKGKTSSKVRPDQDNGGTQDSKEDDQPMSNTQGAPVTGNFCQFSLAAKFPYKYMNDSNDRVSKHFFANNKFYDRTWDM